MRAAESARIPAPNLQLLTLSNLKIHPDPNQGVLGALYDRRDKIALKGLVVRSCRVYDDRYKKWFGELVETVTWDDVTVVELTDDESESESEDYGSDYNFYRSDGAYAWAW